MGTLVDGVTYTNTSDDPGTSNRVVTITGISDSGASNNVAAPNRVSTVGMTGVNDAPTMSATGATPTYTENGSAVTLFSATTIGTVESGQTIVALSFTISGIADANEILGIDGSTVTLVPGSGTTASNSMSYTVAVVGSTATITLSKTGGISTAAAQTLVNGTTYRVDGDTPTAGARVVTITGVQDNGGTSNGGVDTTTLSIAATVTVANANDAPTITAPGTISVTEDTASPITGISFSDADAGANTVTATLSVPSGSLAATTGGNVTVGGTSSALTLSGAIADINTFVSGGGVTFTTASNATSNVTLTVGIDDGGHGGSGGPQSASASVTLSVTAVNDAPTITAPASIAATEDVSSALTGISFADVDAGSASLTATFGVPAGTLAATSGGGVTVGGTASALTLTGSAANLNTFIAGSNVTYTTASHATANVTLTVGIDDGGNTGPGGSQTASTTVSLVVTAVNDAPTITAPGSIALSEDVTTALTGISFADADAGSGAVTATFSVASGTLVATSGSGVTVGGTTAILTLTGGIADVNAFVAASGVAFTTAADATANVTLGVAIDDGGNSGAGGAQSATTSVTLAVSAVNDAPVNTVPGSQTVLQDGTLSFTAGNGNALAVSDVDAGHGGVQVTLTASNGLITLGSTSGLAFTVGSGTGDATMTFGGSIADINSALAGLSFAPASGYHGPASLAITTDDLGLNGSGGSQTDTDVIAITVSQLAPTITSVTATSPGGTYKLGAVIVIAATFDQNVTVDASGGTPTILLETGTVDRAATYLAGSGSTTLLFSYAVQSGDSSADLDYASVGALSLNGATISNGSVSASIALPLPGGPSSIAGQAAIVVDGIVPAVTSVTVPAPSTYAAGQALGFTVSFAEPVLVTGVPSLSILLDSGGPMTAGYVSGSGTTMLTFSATVAPGQNDADGIALIALELAGATIGDGAGNVANTTLQGVASTTGVLIDTTAPGVSIGTPSVTSTVNGPVSFDVTYSGASSISLTEADVTLVSIGTASATVSVGGAGSTRTVTLSAITGSGTLAIRIAAATAQDAAGNDAAASGPSATVAVSARVLTSVYPMSGVHTGGVELTLRGAGFASIGAPGVSFGATPAAAVTVVDDTTMTVVTPALAAGAAHTDGGLMVRTGALDVVLQDGSTEFSTLPAAYLPLAQPIDATTDADGDTLPDLWEVRHGLDAVAAGDATMDPDADGLSNLAEHAAGTHPRGSWTRYFAEGVSSEMMSTSLVLFNPGEARGSVVVHYLREGAGEVTETLDLEPGASVERQASQVPGLTGTAFAIEIESSVSIVATSRSSWDATEYGAGAETASESAATWYLAEGSTKGPFDLFYLLANPNGTPIEVDVTFLLPAPAAPLVRRVTVPARRRLTLWVDTMSPELASTDVSATLTSVGHEPFVVERAMYADDGSGRWGAAGHRAAGVPLAANTWHLAEGYVGGPFDTYVLIANPQAVDAAVTIDVHGDSGVAASQPVVVPARSRVTLHAGDFGVPDGPASFTVRATNGQPVVVERAMWWREAPGAGPWVESHASAGATAGATRWGLSDLRVGSAGASSQYVMVLNTEPMPVSVELTAHLPNGQRETRSYVIAGASRLTLDVASEFPSPVGGIAGMVLTSSGQIVVEASRYWDASGAHWATGANVRATPLR